MQRVQPPSPPDPLPRSTISHKTSTTTGVSSSSSQPMIMDSGDAAAARNKISMFVPRCTKPSYSTLSTRRSPNAVAALAAASTSDRRIAPRVTCPPFRSTACGPRAHKARAAPTCLRWRPSEAGWACLNLHRLWRDGPGVGSAGAAQPRSYSE